MDSKYLAALLDAENAEIEANIYCHMADAVAVIEPGADRSFIDRIVPVLKSISRSTGIPIYAAGGIVRFEDIKKLIYAGASVCFADLSKLELSSEEKSDAKEKDLSTQSYAFVLSNKEINKRYNNALQYFQAHRDNAAQIEVNMILNSDASVAVKKKARLLMGYFEVPDFDTIRDVPSYADVAANPAVYIDCWVNWGGKISNAVTYEDGSYSCDFLVGDETLSKYEGSVRVRFSADPGVDVSKAVKILGKIVI